MSRWLELVADARQLGSTSAASTRSPSSFGGQVEHHARAEEPVERQLVDRLRGLAGDRRVVVPGRVHVGGVVGAEAGELLDRPALAVAQQAAPARRAAPRSAAAPSAWSTNSMSVRSASGSSGGLGSIGADRSTSRTGGRVSRLDACLGRRPCGVPRLTECDCWEKRLQSPSTGANHAAGSAGGRSTLVTVVGGGVRARARTPPSPPSSSPSSSPDTISVSGCSGNEGGEHLQEERPHQVGHRHGRHGRRLGT